MSDEIGADDLPLLLADFGRPVITPTTSGVALVDQHSIMIPGRRVATITTLTAVAAVLSSLRVGDPVSVDGADFVVDQPPMSGADGALMSVQLRSAD